MIWILLVVVVISLGVIGASAIICWHQIKKAKDNDAKRRDAEASLLVLRAQNDDLHKAITNQSSVDLPVLQAQKEGLTKDIEELQRRKNALEVTWGQDMSELQRKKDELEVKLTSEIEELQKRKTELEELLKKVNDELLASKDGQVKCIEEVQRLEAVKRKWDEELSALEQNIKVNQDELDRVLSMRQAMRTEGITMWTPHLTGDREKELFNMLRKIKDLYPDLSADIANIEWKRIWLPQLQEISKELEVKGIYRLVLVDDDVPRNLGDIAAAAQAELESYKDKIKDGQENNDNNENKENLESKDRAVVTPTTVGYVGQAVNIKMRWYQHVKKMIGVDAKGNEKLYQYDRPDKFVWMIIESGDNVNLNKSEKYWIEYFGLGLNRKR